MKVLWITNILFPEAQALLGGNNIFNGSGGWMLASAEELVKRDVDLWIATVSNQVQRLAILKGNQINYCVIPYGKGNLVINHDYESFWLKVKDVVNPDIVHIHGTEFSHGLSYVDANGTNKVVVSIQGLVSQISKYYYSGISCSQIVKNITFSDIVHRSTLFQLKLRYKKRARFEIEYLKRCHNLIGRTSWDKAHIWAVNSMAKYYICNESLRGAFYNGNWSYENCIPHTIFISQAGTPIKGFHKVIEALYLVKKQYPNVHINVGGYIINKNKTFSQKIRLGGYGKFLNSIIDKYGLKDSITFLGSLDELQMKEQFLKANVFVLPSSIENSPNSLGEAQLLGVPCVVSSVGGAVDFVPDKECGYLYNFEDVEMLAFNICKVFAESVSFDNRHERLIAAERHDPYVNCQTLLSIYSDILSYE